MPAAVSMPDQAIGATSGAQTVTLSQHRRLRGHGIVDHEQRGGIRVVSVDVHDRGRRRRCTFSVTFTPSAVGMRSATITVISNGTGNPQTIAVSGSGLGARATPPATTATAIEYYHQAFDHYFITAIADEITKLDNGTFVGWARTGKSFKVYPVTTATGLNTVCRFFSTAFGPKSSHFYTTYPEPECTMVKSNPNWQFEAETCSSFRRRPSTATARSTRSRSTAMYNNGQGAAPNHRYTTDLAVRARCSRWAGLPEGTGAIGVIMCTPP